MGIETFLRLPEEKRNRFLDAAWEEFTRVKFTDASINKIVLRARIPRGSFYQYFADKEDLFAYLLNDIREQFMELFGQLLKEVRGDLFEIHMIAYDRFVGEGVQTNPLLDRCIRMMRLNAGMDLEKLMPGKTEKTVVDCFWNNIDVSAFRQKNLKYARQAFSLTGIALGSAIMDSLCYPEDRDAHREDLKTRLDIIKYGCLKGLE